MKVSIIIPAYDCAAFLPACLESVFAQTWSDHEVVVVDDGSTDDTEAALKPWLGRIRLIRQANAGAAAARNAGIRNSSAPLVAFLDADDTWEPRKLELQAGVLERATEAGLVCSDFSIVSADGSVRRSYFEEHGYATGRVFSRLVADCFLCTSVVMMRRALLDEIGMFDDSMRASEDYNLWLRAALRSRVEVVTEVLCTVVQRPGNARPFEQTTECWVEALRRLPAHEMTREERRLVRSKIGRLEGSLGNHLLKERRRREALPHIWAAMKAGPSRLRPALQLGLSLMPAAVRRVIRKVRSPRG